MLPFAGNAIQRLIELGLANLGSDVSAEGALNMELVTSTDFDPNEFVRGKLLEITLFDNTAPLEAYALFAVVVPGTCQCGMDLAGIDPSGIDYDLHTPLNLRPTFDCDVTVCGLCVRLKYDGAFSDRLCGFIEMVTDWRNW